MFTFLNTVLGFAKKVPLWMWLLLVAIGYVAYTQNHINDLKAEVAKAKLSLTETREIRDGLFARLTSTQLLKDSLNDALIAEKETNAELVAAAKIRVKPDTVWRTNPTVITRVDTVSGSRTAAIDDTTAAGVLRGTIKAPPFPAELEFEYMFEPAPIEFTVSLLRYRNNDAVFAVSYAGGSAEVVAPYARLPKSRNGFEGNLYGGYDVLNSTPVLAASAKYTIFERIYGIVDAQHSFTDLEGTFRDRLLLGGGIRF